AESRAKTAAAEGGVVIEGVELPQEKEEKGVDRGGPRPTPVRCSKCGTVTPVVITKKPYKFKCPECGARLMIK
ncbi:MAG: hypothetical protein J7L61_01480, partial [Thermoplasmata archaeon]|nr:hypothetical protein [Thermoplasmata archaeon]